MLDQNEVPIKQQNQINKEKINKEKEKIPKIIKINDNKDYNTNKKRNKLLYLKNAKSYLILILFLPILSQKIF